jgi:hypothetical protein
MAQSLLGRLLIVAATILGAIFCVWMTNSIWVVLAIAAVAHLATMQRKTSEDAGDRDTVVARNMREQQ